MLIHCKYKKKKKIVLECRILKKKNRFKKLQQVYNSGLSRGMNTPVSLPACCFTSKLYGCF